MQAKLRHLWEALTSGYWFVPSVLTVAAAIAALVMLWVDRHALQGSDARTWFYGGGADGAKTLLSTVASSVITVAGVVFSITIAALTQASSQFGPRLLRRFMRDTGNQVVLGTFVATFLYCLLVLRTIHGEDRHVNEFVPQVSVTGAVLLAMASIVVLIYFIHHVSTALQAPSVVAAAKVDLRKVIARISDDRAHESAEANARRTSCDATRFCVEAASCDVVASKEGYVQVVDYRGLIELAREADLVLRLHKRPGDYIIRGSPLAQLCSSDHCNSDLERRMNAAFICGDHPTHEQDIEYAVRQMVEIAVRALSPGINDPFTAINCIDALGTAICEVSRARLPGPDHYDREGRLRVIARVTTFDGLVDASFNQIRQYGSQSVAVLLRLLEVLGECAAQVPNASQRAALLRHAKLVYEQSRRSIEMAKDREDLETRWSDLVKRFREFLPTEGTALSAH